MKRNWIIAGTEDIYREFLRTHKVQEADYPRARSVEFLRGVEPAQEVILTCLWYNADSQYEMIRYFRSMHCRFARIPCQDFCRGDWDRVEL